MAVEQIRFSSSIEESDNEETLISKSSSTHVAKVPVERRIDFMVVQVDVLLAWLHFFLFISCGGVAWCLTVHTLVPWYTCASAAMEICVQGLSAGPLISD